MSHPCTHKSPPPLLHNIHVYHSTTKASITLGLLFAYYHTQDTTAVDSAYLLVLGGLILSSIKLFTVLSRNVDPFTKPQELIWGFLTILSFFPPSPPTTCMSNIGQGVGGNGFGNGGNGKSKKQVRFSSDVKTDEDHLKED